MRSYYVYRIGMRFFRWLLEVQQAHQVACAVFAGSVAIAVAVWAYRINRDRRPYTP